ncbi:cell envelope integrity protein CreD [Niabella terrae]
METMPTSFEKNPGFFERNKNLIKGFLIGFLILLMLIPAGLLQGLVRERKDRQQEVMEEISSKWASAQTVVGPALVIPYQTYEKDKDGKIITTLDNLVLLPHSLDVNGQLLPEIRHRSLYDVSLYKSVLRLKGVFMAGDLAPLQLKSADIRWNEAKLVLGLNDARGLEEEVSIKWARQMIAMDAGIPVNTAVKQGLSAPVPFDPQSDTGFEIQLKLKGSEHLFFTPVGKTTLVQLSSDWKDPAFDGDYLPVASHVTDSGFNARWKVLQVSRSYPQTWLDEKYDLEASAFGVKLIQPTDSYAKTERSVKYAILFIALTFIVFFFLEIIQKRQIHPLQYLLVGFSLCVFYTLLLSISEYTGFNPAYLIASVATVLLIGFYIWGIFKKRSIALLFTAALAGLYLYIYILIQLQDYALLFGSLGLFVIIALLMYFSKKIDWYDTSSKAS